MDSQIPESVKDGPQQAIGSVLLPIQVFCEFIYPLLRLLCGVGETRNGGVVHGKVLRTTSARHMGLSGAAAPREAARRRKSTASHQVALTAIVFSLFWASAVLGRRTVRTPFAKFASIFSTSTPSGTWNERWNEP